MSSTSKMSNKATAYLKTIVGNPVGKIFSLTSREVIIGRNRQSAQICIKDPNVSRSHCVLEYGKNNWYIKDLESVNGTFLDGKMLETQKFYPLKDGAGIYLGPPGEAATAFIFLTKMPNEQSCETNMKNCNQKSRRKNTHIPVFVSNKNDKRVKRPSDSESSITSEGFSQRKKKAASSSTYTTTTSQGQDTLDEIEDVGNSSDCSISSLDSLRNELQKKSAKKRSYRNTRKRHTRNATSSASPQSSSVESQPSTSTTPAEIPENKTYKSLEPAMSKEFVLLDSIFNESESSTPAETAEEKLWEEKLKETMLEIEKAKEDRLHLLRLAKQLKSEALLKQKAQGEFRKILEDELICNICTEIFIKAVALGCSHTFCEHCLSEWKKKQKKCPICREKIASETKVLALDSFINKAVDRVDAETQKRRKKLMASREKIKAIKQKKNKHGRRIRSNRSEAVEIRQRHSEPSNSIGVQIRFSGNSSPSIHVIRENIIDELGSDFSALSDGSDISVDGFDNFDGYGICYNCGRNGHWAHECSF